MKHKTHSYSATVQWTGNLGQGTSSYRAYTRDHEISIPGKPVILGSADPAFRGDPSRYNPEELLVASLSTCHMLWYLHLCADAGVTVTHYSDDPAGTMVETDDGGHFTEILLQPKVTVKAGTNLELAIGLHEKAHRFCFIANSVNFPVRCQPSIAIDEASQCIS